MKESNTYIMNLEACYLYKDIVEDKKTTFNNRDLAKLFSATSPYSLETIRMDKMFTDTFYELKGKQYTKKIINVTFDKNYFIWVDEKIKNKENKKSEEETDDSKSAIVEQSDNIDKKETERKRKVVANKNKIRKYFYKNGFEMDGVKYVFYKRGAGKAKNGYAFFIQEDMKDSLIKRSRLGLEFEENELLDLTSLLAYESLISSGIEFIINLNPKTEILLIDDINGLEFESLASVTKEEKGILTTKNELVKLQNCLSDGQGLLDESVFQEHDKSEKGFMLLRSDMFKDCAFNTKLQKWFEHNEIDTLTDMFGNIYESKNIKLIITPNSLKFLKFAYKFTEGKTKIEYDKLNDDDRFKIDKKCYEYWKDNIDDIFGVVKCDKEGNYGNYNRTTYQLLNSIPNLTYDDLMEITELEREYVKLLKNDNAVFRNYIGCDAIASLKLEKSIDDNNISLYENTDLMNALLLVNSDIQYTTKFKKMKSDLIANYIGHLREGKIRLKDAKYVTIISNPYEMLLSVIGQYKNESIMKGREVYCKYYNDGQEFCISRNPHINSGNVMCAKNVYHEEYDWFNFTDNIMAVNFFDNDMPDRLQGEDTDSDTNLIIPSPVLVAKAKYCEDNFTTPLNRVKGSAIPRKNNMAELQKLDVILSNNYIGRIVNMSQIINSYLNDAISKNESKDIIDGLYHASSRLSSMSQIEIDKSKKVFDNISMSKELAKMKEMPYIRYIWEEDKYGKESKKMIVPNFFDMISESNEYRVFEKFNTPLDILQDVLVFEGGTRLRGVKHKELKDLLVQTKELDGRYNKKSATAIFKIIETCGKRINGLQLKTNTLNDKSKNTIRRKSKKDAVDKLKKLTPNDSTILCILKQCFGEKEDDKFGFKKYGMLTLNLLFISKKMQVLKCFKNNNMDIDEVLMKIKGDYAIEIFGDKYQRLKRKDLKILNLGD